MARNWLLLNWLFLFTCINAQTTTNDTECRCVPGDECWPSPSEWAAFNETLGGKLIATNPISSICHYEDFGDYNEEGCANLQSVFFYPETHLEVPSSIMAPWFTNDSCNPFLPPNVSCTLGTAVSYSVNASSPEDYQKTIQFTTERNIRLVIKNTGHDYNGKGTGAGAVGIWTYNMKWFELIETYTSPNYTGKAIRMSAGVSVGDLYQFAYDNGLIAMGGTCPTVGVAGGYTQGGGHGPLASLIGLSADNALEWEVVTGTGEYLTASSTNNSDLHWALAGGGGGTFGVVYSLTVKAYPDLPTSGANMTFNMTGNEDQAWEVVEVFQATVGALVDTGSTAEWYISDGSFALAPVTAPGVSVPDLQMLLNPTLSKLNETGIPYSFYIAQFDSYLDSFNAFTPPWNVSENQIGGRLIPRSLVEQNNSALISAMRSIINTGAVISGVCVNVSQGSPSPDSNAVNPYWRGALYDAVIGTPFSYTNWSSNVYYQNQMTEDLIPQLAALTPNGGAYLNEADFQQPNFQSVFWGDHYDTLKSIKAKYDPNDIFYAITAVNSDGWYEDQSHGGRLCRKP